jgi:hypothetical protein
MDKPQIKIVNVQTGKETNRDATVAEIAQIKLDAEQSANEKIESATRAAQRQAILDKLGLTADEAQLLLG